MPTAREEAAPSFTVWKRRLEQADHAHLQEEVARFRQMLHVIGTPLIDGPEVNFIYCDPAARQVRIVGEFNEWSKRADPIEMMRLDGTGVFYHTLTLTEPARLEYKFVVDGEWKTDPFCPNVVDNGVGDQNSYFETGDFRDPPELQYAAEIPHGRVEEFDFRSERLNNSRRTYVYLPPGYDGDTRIRFSSFYIHDGGEYLERARMATVMDNLTHAGQISPVLLIMIDPVNRMREYWANQDYAEFLCAEFIPEIDRRYRTVVDRKNRGVMGASLGGLISTYTALSYPQIFSKVAGQSSALHLEEDRISALLGGLRGKRLSFYFDVGRYEPSFIPAHQRFIASLKAKRWPCRYQELPGGHNWTSWRAHLKDLLVFLWPPAPLKRPSPLSTPVRRRARRTSGGDGGES
jgi:enterochelin esterase-like enzyme